MENIEHKIIPVNGLKMHVAELGEGPLVLFVHGFPELWYSWRHQMVFLAAHGYRAVAPDLRGYGDTTGAPLDDPSKFTVLHLVGDLILLLDAIAPGEEKVFVVGHDWGALIAWHLCLYRPDRVKALVNLSVAFYPRNPEVNPVEMFRGLYGDDHYICRFQEPGDIEAEFANVGVKEVVKNILHSALLVHFIFPRLGLTYLMFIRTFPAAANCRNWELTAPWSGAQVKVPAKFIIGEFDLTYHVPGTKDYIHKGGFQKFVPLLQEVVVLEGAAHFINQERPDEINELIYAFLKQF
ncbi:UNVERIFIED_CONTAM: Epoxide hydrolase A [Sesamum radiatum]|uniref:Epoxide hydrolase A n=1 Tax=Sesamum radiatum TaxID=300843 RepID=A0AAW2S9T1_SESRA